MVRVIYDHDTYEGYAAAKSDNDIWVYDEHWSVIHHISGIYGSEWNYISIENGDWTDLADIPSETDVLRLEIERLQAELASLQGQSGEMEEQLNAEILRLQRQVEALEQTFGEPIVGYISGESVLIGNISGGIITNYELPPVLEGYISIPDHYGTIYDGIYEIIPTDNFQIVNTEEKFMEEDILVHPIPYSEVSNNAGGYTATIGG